MFLFCAGWLNAACAASDELQVYDGEIAAPGAVSIAWHNNYTPRGDPNAPFPGGIVADRTLNGVVETAYGVKPWFEAGLYLPLYSLTSDNELLYNGFKLRALFVSPGAAQRRVFYGVNFEFSVNTRHWNERRYTSEIRPIIGAHVGRFDFVFNPILDNSWTGVRTLQFVPAARVAMMLSGSTKIAVEDYAGLGTISRRLPYNRQSHQMFLVLNFPTAWFDVEAGVGAGLTAASDHRIVKLILTKDFGAPL